MARRPFTSFFVSLLALGCSGGGGASAPPADSAGASTTAATPLSATSGTTSDTATPLPTTAPASLEIGYPSAPAAVPKAAVDANTKAFKEHKAGHFEASRAGFEEAVRLSPDYFLARYNLACARARTGDIRGATTLLWELFALDLPQMGDRFEKDPDLESVRSAPEGQVLRTGVQSLSARYREEASRGVPAVLWRGGPAHSGALSTAVFRQGVYLPASRRFLPLGPAPAGSDMLGAIVDVAHDAVLLVRGSSMQDCSFDFCPRISSIQLERHALWDTASPPIVWKPDDDGSFLWTAHVAFADDGFLFQLTTRYEHWMRVGPGGKLRDDPAAKPLGPGLQISASGTLPENRVAGARVHAHTLTLADGTKVPLDPAHRDSMTQSIHLSPDGSFAVVSSVVSTCECDKHEGPVLLHAVSRVDIAAKTATLLSKDGSSAAAAIGPDGAIYLQTGSKTAAIPAGAALTTRDPLPDGVLLTPPDIGPSNCCGL